MLREARRLSPDVKPLFYRLYLKPDFVNSESFEGVLELIVELGNPAESLTFNQLNLTLSHAYIMHRGKRIIIQDIQHDQQLQRVTLHWTGELSGAVMFSIKFEGKISDDLRGLYRSSYKDAAGQTQHLLTTQCEATDARRIFPCFDEPSFKAPIELTVIAPADKTVVANMNFAVRDFYKGKQKVEFVRTPPMSTHIFALVIGDLEYIEKVLDDVTMRVYTTPEKREQARFALDFACFTLRFLNDYFDIPYPLKKLDLLAIPDFAAGAMENWGAITFRESMLLVDERSTMGVKRSVASVIAHEIVHMWFGNLVTPEWWDDLWLKEAFATFLANIVMDKGYPEWRVWEVFMGSTAGALAKDGLHSTHPIQVPTYTEDDIAQNYDAISYNKGGAVLHQNLGHIGPANFRLGVQEYLKKHALGNAKTADLWEAFETVSGEPVRRIMRSFTEQSGYPVLDVKRIDKCTLALSQSRFVYGAPNAKDEALLWHIPITITDVHNPSQCIKLVMHRRTKRVKLPSYIQTPVLNPDLSGFYRVNYSSELINELHVSISQQTLPAVLRAGVLDDSFALVLSGAKPLQEFFDLLQAYSNEQEYVVFRKVLAALSALENLAEGNNHLTKKLQEFQRQFLRPAFERLGWDIGDNDSTQQRLLRAELTKRLGYCDDQDIVNEAQKLFGLGKDLHPDLRAVIYSIVAHHGGGYEALLERYIAEDMSALRNELLRALTEFPDEERLKRTIEFAFSPHVRSQDAFIVMGAAAANTPLGPTLVWDHLEKHWDKIHERFGEGGMRSMGDFVVPAIAHMRQKSGLKRIKAFLGKHPIPSATRDIEEAFEVAELRILWRKRLMPELKKYFG